MLFPPLDCTFIPVLLWVVLGQSNQKGETQSSKQPTLQLDALLASLSSTAESALDFLENPSGGLMLGISQETHVQQEQTKGKADLPLKPLVSRHTCIC